MQNRLRPAGYAAAALAAAAFTSPCAAAPKCGADLAGARRIESASYTVAFRTQPRTIAVGKHFAVEFALCAGADRPAPDSVRVDAIMPAHKHGMNYAPTIEKTAPGRYRADGLLFHMPGQWDLTFEVQSLGRTERITQSLIVR